MIRFLIIGIVLSTLLSSCQEEQPPIPQSEMVNILTDLHMSEAYAQLNPIDKGGYMTKNYDTMLILYSHIFKKHSLDSTSFKTALIWYKQRPDVFDKVYEEILTKLSLMKEIGLDSTMLLQDSLPINNQDTL